MFLISGRSLLEKQICNKVLCGQFAALLSQQVSNLVNNLILEPLITIMGGKMTVPRCEHVRGDGQCKLPSQAGARHCKRHRIEGDAVIKPAVTQAPTEKPIQTSKAPILAHATESSRMDVWVKMLQGVIRNPIRM